MFAIDLTLPILFTSVSLIGAGYYYMLQKKDKGRKITKETIQTIFFLASLQFFFLGADVIMGLFVQGGGTSAYQHAMDLNLEVQVNVLARFGGILIAWTVGSVLMSLTGVLESVNRDLLAPAIWSSVSALIDLNNQLVLQWWTLWMYQNVVGFLIFFGAMISSLTILESNRIGWAICLNALAIYIALPIGINVGYDFLMLLQAEQGGMILGAALTPFTMPAAILLHQATMIWLPAIVIGLIVLVSQEIIGKLTGERKFTLTGFISGVMAKT